MINKIVWASYGNQESGEAIEHIKFLAAKYNAEVVGVYVKPTEYFQGIEYLPSEESGIFSDWIEKSSREIIKQIEEDAEVFKKEGLGFRLLVREGVPHEEILRAAVDENADLIVIGKGKTPENEFSIARTVFKLIRQSNIPVLAVDKPEGPVKIMNVVVPTGLYKIHSKDFDYAVNISKDFESKLFHLNVMNTANLNLPAEVINKLRGDTYTKIAETDIDYKNIEPRVVESVNPAKGISDFVSKNNIDLVVMLTYSGRKKRGDDFIGSVAQKVLQDVNCPVITIRP